MSRYVIGDIHGCVDELRRLIGALPLRLGDSLIFLGDYIDRGPDSAGVVAHLIALQSELREVSFVFLRGNHEDMLLSYLGLAGQHGDMFLINGGKATLASYGLSEAVAAEKALSAIPPERVAALLASRAGRSITGAPAARIRRAEAAPTASSKSDALSRHAPGRASPQAVLLW